MFSPFPLLSIKTPFIKSSKWNFLTHKLNVYQIAIDMCFKNNITWIQYVIQNNKQKVSAMQYICTYT